MPTLRIWPTLRLTPPRQPEQGFEGLTPELPVAAQNAPLTLGWYP